MPSGVSTGERVPGHLYQQVVDRASIGGSLNSICRATTLSWPTVKAIIQRESRAIEIRKAELLDQTLRIARRAAHRLENEIDNAPFQFVPTTFGVAYDKIAPSHRQPRKPLSNISTSTSSKANRGRILIPSCQKSKPLPSEKQSFNQKPHPVQTQSKRALPEFVAAKMEPQLYKKAKRRARSRHQTYSEYVRQLIKRDVAENFSNVKLSPVQPPSAYKPPQTITPAKQGATPPGRAR